MNASNNSSSKDYSNCYVAFLDILGFKTLARVNSHEHLKVIYQKFRDVIEHGLSNGKYVLFDVGMEKSIGPDIRQAKVNSLIVSDSILIWTDDNSPESFENIVKAVQSLLAFSVIDGIPLRGAIAIGSFTLALSQWPSHAHNFQHSLYGRAIVEAAETERQQKWCGCEISAAAIECYKSIRLNRKSLFQKKVILQYTIPKEPDTPDAVGYVIDWVNHPEVAMNAEAITGAFNPPVVPEPKEWEKIKIKLENTLKFLDAVKH